MVLLDYLEGPGVRDLGVGGVVEPVEVESGRYRALMSASFEQVGALLSIHVKVTSVWSNANPKHVNGTV